eukprot:CAMPEP_0113323664 /NCGR_PEP_ID=MMETSP0010_2-20120614/16477_1 /TAXON_ID=216773 ORGANISM="Corethron hystrix, Strain 308" /NCGR_SAMPLE_ID=MMETSP0010_2 /ASSEMBLY_ACC=CAM_ASM_000155 /LENGTH=31 /DNA_ID=CAMNT_0000182681 /DNA_START=135 /DNA_END=230 /DNA_ORIENTATION=- /assembly_acc=CAM_ASM_000155
MPMWDCQLPPTALVDRWMPNWWIDGSSLAYG